MNHNLPPQNIHDIFIYLLISIDKIMSPHYDMFIIIVLVSVAFFYIHYKFIGPTFDHVTFIRFAKSTHRKPRLLCIA